MSARSAIQAYPSFQFISPYVHFISIAENCVAWKSELQKDGYKAERAHVISDVFTGMHTQTRQTTSGAPSKACLLLRGPGERVVKEMRGVQP